MKTLPDLLHQCESFVMSSKVSVKINCFNMHLQGKLFTLCKQIRYPIN